MRSPLLFCVLALPALTACQQNTRQVMDVTPQSVNPPKPSFDPETVLPITHIEQGADIGVIPSEKFDLKLAVMRGDVLELTVQYIGGMQEHDFTLYWSGISTRSIPPQYPMTLKHDENGDSGRVSLTDIIRFDLSSIPRPAVVKLSSGSGHLTTIKLE